MARVRKLVSPSGRIGKYIYYTDGDIRQSIGCGLCLAYLYNNYNEKFDFWKSFEDLVDEACSKCPSNQAALMLKEYAEELDKYEEMYADDGR